MKIRLLALLAAVLTTIGVARAEDFQFTSSQQMGAEIQRQAEEIDELKAEFASFRNYAEGAGACGCNDVEMGYCDSCCNSGCCGSCCNGGCCDSCCPTIGDAQKQSGFYAYAEAVVVRPFLAQGFGANQSTGGEFALAATPRATVGWVGDCGFGFRGRYWQYRQFGGSPPNPNVLDTSINLQVIDLEATDRICLGQWLLTGFGGVRYVRELDTYANPAARARGSFIDNFEGLGLTAGLDLLRPISCNWSLYGNARGSVMVGTQNYETNGNPIVEVRPNGFGGGRHAIRDILEFGLGVQYNRQLANGLGLFGRAGLEIQYWGSGKVDANVGFAAQNNPNAARVGNYLRQDSGFAGFTFGAGVMF